MPHETHALIGDDEPQKRLATKLPMVITVKNAHLVNRKRNYGMKHCLERTKILQMIREKKEYRNIRKVTLTNRNIEKEKSSPEMTGVRIPSPIAIQVPMSTRIRRAFFL